MANLTEREKEVLKLMAEGLTNEQIALKLFIAPTTVKTHAVNIYGKFGLPVTKGTTTRIKAVIMGIQQKLLDVSFLNIAQCNDLKV